SSGPTHCPAAASASPPALMASWCSALTARFTPSRSRRRRSARRRRADRSRSSRRTTLPSSPSSSPSYCARTCRRCSSFRCPRARRPRHQLRLPEDGPCAAGDPSGGWLAGGTSKANVLVFESEGRHPFELSASEKPHEGAVTALLFEPQELRFYSAGADNKLL